MSRPKTGSEVMGHAEAVINKVVAPAQRDRRQRFRVRMARTDFIPVSLNRS